LVDGDASEFAPNELTEWKTTHAAGTSSDRYLRNMESPQWIPPRLVVPRVARADLLDQLGQALETGNVAVVGLAGVGKTQLVSSYFRESETLYTQRLWLKGSTRAQIETELAALAVATGDFDSNSVDVSDAASHALEGLESVPGYLLVLDGVREFSEVRDLAPSNGRLIVISQSRSWPGFQTMSVGGMDDEEAMSLLGQYSLDPDMEQVGALLEVAHECGGNALLLCQAGQYIATRGIPPSSYLELLRAERLAVLERGGSGFPESFHSSVALGARELSEDSRLLAGMLSLVSDSPIAVRSISEIRDNWPDDLLASRLRLEDALGELLRYSFVEREGERVRMHSIVQAFFKADMTPEKRSAAYAYASMLVHSQTPVLRMNAEAHRRFRDAVPHMEALVGASEDFPELAAVTVPPLANRLGSFYVDTGRFELGTKILERAADLAESEGEGDRAALASLRHNLANLALEQGDLRTALQGALHAQQMKEQLAEGEPGNESFVAYTHVLVGDIYGQMGESDKAIEHNVRAAELHEQGGAPGLAAGALHTIATIYIEELGEASNALAVLRRSKALLSDERSDGFVSEQIRHAIIWTTFHLRLDDDFVAAARWSKFAERLVVADQPSSLDLPRILILRARSLASLGQVSSAFALLRRAEALLADVEHAQAVEVEKVRGNLGAAYMSGRCGTCALRLTTESADSLHLLLPPGNPTRIVADRLVQEASALEEALRQTSFASVCPGPH